MDAWFSKHLPDDLVFNVIKRVLFSTDYGHFEFKRAVYFGNKQPEKWDLNGRQSKDAFRRIIIDDELQDVGIVGIDPESQLVLIG